jgi:hypothetical protein
MHVVPLAVAALAGMFGTVAFAGAARAAAHPFARSAAMPQGEGTPAQPQRGDELLARYRKLDADKRADVARNVERRFTRENSDVLQSIVGMQQGRAAYAARGQVRWYEPRDHAPGATPRTLLAPASAHHKRMTHGMRPFVLLPELAAAVAYDWQQGVAAWNGADLTDEQKIANVARGFAPGADHAVARVLLALDRAPRARELGDYFEHLYADRDGAVFGGVSLYDAWRSGKKLEMPDTDTVAFARLVLRTQAYVAPLPTDRRRERLYQKIATAYAEHHEHRTLCQALAATFVAATPSLDPAWQSLAERCHWIWHRHGRDVQAVAKWLQGFPDRSAVVDHVDAAMQRDDAPMRAHRTALADLAATLQSALDEELSRAGG